MSHLIKTRPKTLIDTIIDNMIMVADNNAFIIYSNLILIPPIEQDHSRDAIASSKD